MLVQPPSSTDRDNLLRAVLGHDGNCRQLTLRQAIEDEHPRMSGILRRMEERLAYAEAKKSAKNNKYVIVGALSEVLPHVTDEIECVSFDFFDTLVQRSVSPPDIVKDKTGQFASMLLGQHGHYVSPSHFRLIRERIEKDLRLYNIYHRQGDYEAVASEILGRTVMQIAGAQSEELAKAILAFEVEEELRVLSLNAGASDLLRKIKEKSKTIVVTSDMYLSTAHIDRVCCALDIRQYIDLIFVSSDVGFVKHTKKLFDVVLNRLQLCAPQVMHVGDHALSDVSAPREHGLKVVHFYDYRQRVAKNELGVRTRRFNDGHLALKEAEALLSTYGLLPECWVRERHSMEEQAILRSVIPALAAFVHASMADIVRMGIRKVFFLAREGMILKRATDTFLQNSALFAGCSGNLTTKVLYVSRRSSSSALYTTYTDTEVLGTTFKRHGWWSPEGFLKTWSVSLDDFSEEAQCEYTTFLMTSTFSYHPHEAFLKGLQRSKFFGPELDSVMAQKKNAFVQYLSQEGVFDDEAVAVVDLGWVGTISRMIQTASMAAQRPTRVFSFFFAASYPNLGEFDDLPRLGNFPGYIVDGGRRVEHFERVSGGDSMLEVLLGDDRIGSTLGYQMCDNRWHPTFETGRQFQENKRIQRMVRHMTRHGVAAYARAFDAAPLSAEALRAVYRDYLFRLFSTPTRREAAMFTKALLDVGATNVDAEPLPLVASIPLKLLLKPRQFAAALKRGAWRRGSMALMGLPNWTLRLYYLMTRLEKIYPHATAFGKQLLTR
jgi:HAD superfamily hydrolase (TIGR01549 family)